MTYDEILSRLEGVHRTGDQASARCPAHEDKTASLEEKRKKLLKEIPAEEKKALLQFLYGLQRGGE